MKYTALKQHLQSNGVQPIYLLEGEDLYFRTKGAEQIKNACLSQPPLNFVSFEGDELKGKDGLRQLEFALRTLPFLSAKRVVAVSEFYPTEREYETCLKGLFELPVDTSVLLIQNSEAVKKTGAKKGGACDLKSKPNVTFVECARAEVSDVVKWLSVTFRRAGIRADGSVCRLIADYCCCDMARIEREAEKLKAYASEGDTVTAADVDMLVCREIEYRDYELSDAASRGDYARFMEILEDMRGDGADENSILRRLCSHFRKLYEVSESRGSDAQVAGKLGLKEYDVKKSRERAAKFGRDVLAQRYADIHDVVCRVRASELRADSALKLTVQRIFFA